MKQGNTGMKWGHHEPHHEHREPDKRDRRGRRGKSRIIAGIFMMIGIATVCYLLITFVLIPILASVTPN